LTLDKNIIVKIDYILLRWMCHMEKFNELTEKIKTLKTAKDILQNEYKKSEFHKKKEANPHDIVPPSPEDEEIFKLLTAIQQIDIYIKKFHNEQLKILKNNK
jgi:hypothetical protein